MANVEQCELALHGLAATLAAKDPATRTKGFDRTLTCSVRDLDVIFAGRLHDGLLVDIARTADPKAQIRLSLSSDDLLSMVDGSLNFAAAWAKGHIKVGAGVRDMIKLRTIF
ncbi:MAG: sterol-binding protein [Jatrophihabitans sp.]